MAIVDILKDNDIIQDKNKIIDLIIKNEDIRALLNTKDISQPEDLVYTYVFPFLKLPKTQDIARNYITMKLSSEDILKSNKIYKDYTLTLCTISHEDEMKTCYGATRIDLLSAALLKIFAWNKTLGFELKPISEDEDILDGTYYIKQITFRTLTPNSMKCGVKING